jgi:hypothetical protein
VGRANQGWSVALSADGNTAIIGGSRDNPWDASVPFGLGAAGAAWVFACSSGVWTHSKRRSLSAPGMPAKACPSRYPPTVTSLWWAELQRMAGASVFTRSGDHWTQDQNLVGTGAVGNSAPSVALSADGSIVLMGAANDKGVSEQHGCSHTAAVTGPRSRSWLAAAVRAILNLLSRCPQTVASL